jgi:hypothetical protein
MYFELKSVVLFKRRSVRRVRMIIAKIPRFLFFLSMLCCLANVGCKVDPFKYLDKNDVLALTPDKIVIAPTNSSTTTTAMGTTQVQMSGGSMDVAVFGATKTGEPREYRHVYVCLGKCPEKDSDSENDSSNPGLESAYSKWVQLSATSAEDGRGCRNVSSEILHCILRSDGTAKFKVVTSGAIYPFAKPIPIHAHSGDANSNGNIWISYGFPDDTKLDLILPAGKQFSVLESSPTNQSICGTTLPCDSIRRALPYSLRLLTKEDMDNDTDTEPSSENELEADTDTESNQERWISVPLDVPVLAQVNTKLATATSELSQGDASSVKVWLSKDSLCSASGLAVQTSQVLAFDQSTAASDTGYVCINGLGCNIELSANVVDYGPSENTILRAKERLSAKPRPAGLSHKTYIPHFSGLTFFICRAR